MNRRLRALLFIVMVATLAFGSVSHPRAQGKDVTFISTQFNVVEETAKANKIWATFKDGAVKFVPSEAGPLIDTLKAEAQAGKGTIDVVGDLHGGFPTLIEGDILLNQADL